MEILESITKRCFSEFISTLFFSKYKGEEFEIYFAGNGDYLKLSFYDLRIERNNFVKIYSLEKNFFQESYDCEIDEPIIVETKESIYNFENKPVLLLIPFHFYEELIPRKFYASNFEYSRGNKVITEFTESKERFLKKVNVELLKIDFEKKLPVFISEIKKRIYLNDLFIENTKYEANKRN